MHSLIFRYFQTNRPEITTSKTVIGVPTNFNYPEEFFHKISGDGGLVMTNIKKDENDDEIYYSASS